MEEECSILQGDVQGLRQASVRGQCAEGKRVHQTGGSATAVMVDAGEVDLCLGQGVRIYPFVKLLGGISSAYNVLRTFKVTESAGTERKRQGLR